MKLTPWFDGRVKPVRPGVYQQMDGNDKKLGYQKWDGRKWYAWWGSAEAAAHETWPCPKQFQNDKWRGIFKAD